MPTRVAARNAHIVMVVLVGPSANVTCYYVLYDNQAGAAMASSAMRMSIVQRTHSRHVRVAITQRVRKVAYRRDERTRRVVHKWPTVAYTQAGWDSREVAARERLVHGLQKR